jgi:6-pyruvoyltetrahydropterin/6-carboxytetrahydropterin synthase
LETFKEFTFEAAHRSLPYEDLHGHSFKVQVVMRGEPHPEFGWSHNFYEIQKPIEDLRGRLDHRYLNDIDGLKFPTLENITRWIWNELDGKIDGLARIVLSRGRDGDAEGCVYAGAG